LVIPFFGCFGVGSLSYVYKSSEAIEMAKYTDFGFSIGVGGSFNLEHYYMLGAEIVQALQEHETLLAKHFERLTDGYYVDDSLHLLAFDLMYCSRTYGYYRGLSLPSKGKSIRKKPVIVDNSAEEKERLTKIEAIEKEIYELNLNCDCVSDISLLGIEVISTKYGTGVVTDQQLNKITIQFQSEKKTFILDNKYKISLNFDGYDEIMKTFTEYFIAQDKIRKLKIQLQLLQK